MADRKDFKVEEVYHLRNWDAWHRKYDEVDRKGVRLTYKNFFVILVEKESGEVTVTVMKNVNSPLSQDDYFPMVDFSVYVNVEDKEDPVYVGNIELDAEVLSNWGINKVTQSLRDLSDFRVALIDLVAHRYEYLDLPLTKQA